MPFLENKLCKRLKNKAIHRKHQQQQNKQTKNEQQKKKMCSLSLVE